MKLFCLYESVSVNLYVISVNMCFFFFSSRRRHTRSLCDWSSDVCSSDLATSEIHEVSNLWISLVAEFCALDVASPAFSVFDEACEIRNTAVGYCSLNEIGRASCRERV